MLHVHRSASADVLVTELGRHLAVPAGDPFAPEIVAVPAKGVERWLAQRLSHVLGAGPDGAGDGAGICANVVFSSPTRLLDDALRAAGGGVPAGVSTGDDGASADPWAPERAVWPLLRILDGGGAGDRIEAHLAGGDRRYAVAARLAALFATYGQERPELIQRWAAGRDETDDGTPVPADLAWQPPLWRRLREEIGVPSPAERLEEALARLADEPGCAALPERFSVFGLNRLSRTRLRVLATLAQRREIRLWIQHASPALWAAVAVGDGPRHPLVRSMSRDVRGLQARLAQVAPGHGDIQHPAPPRPDTLLGRLQVALAADEVPAPAERPLLAADDHSVVVHSCHGRARQVEVLRETVLERLAADPTLQPRDILVMCPDIEQFAPLVAAAFAERDAGEGAERGPGHPAAGLRVRLADRALRQANPLFGTLATLLELARGRVTAAAVLDLAATAPVRRRFGFDAEDSERLADWVADARICWGVDAAHRRRYALPTAQGTWRDGLDRLLLGVAMEAGQTWLGEAVPLDDVDSAKIGLAGRFAELVDRLGHALTAIAQPHPLDEWVDLLLDAVLSLAAPGPGEAWQTVSLASELEDLRDAAGGSDTPLTPGDVAALLAGRLAGRPTRASFRTGTLTVCTMVPMRSVPHRVIVLLGLDDGTFPRAGVVDGDDLLARAPRPGERDPRSEDRQLLLDAVGAAGEHLIVLYTGADERSGAPIPPAVPVGELLDALDGVARTADGRSVAAHVTVRHPLQVFDPRNFGVDLPGAPAPARRPISFDRAALAGARALLAPRTAARELVDGALPPCAPGPVELTDLIRMLTHPARGFLRQRLEIGFPDEDTDPPDALPVELDGLSEWAIGDRLLRQRLRGIPIDVCCALELRRGALPPGALGRRVLSRVGARVDAITAMVADELGTEPRIVDIDVELRVAGVPRRLTGTVGGVRGVDFLRVEYSSLKAKQRLSAWIELLALLAMHPDEKWRGTVVGRRSDRAARRVLGPVEPDAGSAVLADLIALRDEGLRRPLPLPVATAERYVSKLLTGSDHRFALDEAEEKEWAGKFAERADDAYCLVYGPNAPLGTLDVQEFSELAVRVWQPLLAAES
ncbi:exodeoxyribonuclease V subunit gamma [Sporichthya polymorpha]|uniref:exodeoxyribonuclease V subunit gamma n=1 Tax=Sporichthya polymorpha TaxID=35751 RepID=UPI0003A2C1C4|nr:exodeoxyribonuclease V subunit gamma [Sporichthya polymorpha]